MKVAVIGTGYVGLVTGTCLAEMGNHVTCIDIDEEKINKLKDKQITIYEPGLEILFKNNIDDLRLDFTTNLKEGIKNALVIFLALPTPPGEDGSADLQYILKVAKDLGPLLTNHTIIVDKSTVPVGTAEKVSVIIQKNTTVDFEVVSNPEFLREGVAVNDFMKPERVIIGAEKEESKTIMKELYDPFIRQGNPIIFMDKRSSELTKYAANAFLATKVSFMNEMANLCTLMDADVDMVRKGIGTDSRIGNRFLFAGVGYGGSCFPKDVRALVKSAKKVDYDFQILNSVMNVNTIQKQKLIAPLKEYFNNQLEGKTVAIWGLAFKPYTDDIREAPALENIKILLEEKVDIKAYDPEAMNNASKIFGNQIIYGKNEYDVLENADALMIMTEWSVFRMPDFERIKKLLNYPLILDGRNLYDVNQMKNLGLKYYSIGRPTFFNEKFDIFVYRK